MAIDPTSFKEIAHAHLLRDMDDTKSWTCECEALRHMRSLVGMDKMLEIWPLVNRVRTAQDQIEKSPDGAEKQGVVELYHNLTDELANKMAE